MDIRQIKLDSTNDGVPANDAEPAEPAPEA
jgi:hypothetical protein